MDDGFKEIKVPAINPLFAQQEEMLLITNKINLVLESLIERQKSQKEKLDYLLKKRGLL